MDTPFKLSLEQQFSLRAFSEQVKDLTHKSRLKRSSSICIDK